MPGVLRGPSEALAHHAALQVGAHSAGGMGWPLTGLEPPAQGLGHRPGSQRTSPAAGTQEREDPPEAPPWAAVAAGRPQPTKNTPGQGEAAPARVAAVWAQWGSAGSSPQASTPAREGSLDEGPPPVSNALIPFHSWPPLSDSPTQPPPTATASHPHSSLLPVLGQPCPLGPPPIPQEGSGQCWGDGPLCPLEPDSHPGSPCQPISTSI